MAVDQDDTSSREPAYAQVYSTLDFALDRVGAARVGVAAADRERGRRGMSCPTAGHPAEVWVWPDERSGGGWAWPPSRVGRWVWRLSGVLHASSLCLACRVGLAGRPDRREWLGRSLSRRLALDLAAPGRLALGRHGLDVSSAAGRSDLPRPAGSAAPGVSMECDRAGTADSATRAEGRSERSRPGQPGGVQARREPRRVGEPTGAGGADHLSGAVERRVCDTK